MTPERAEQIDSMLLDSLKDGPKYLDMGRSPVEAIERCFALIEAGEIHLAQSGWVYLVRKPSETATSEARALTQTAREKGSFPH